MVITMHDGMGFRFKSLYLFDLNHLGIFGTQKGKELRARRPITSSQQRNAQKCTFYQNLVSHYQFSKFMQDESRTIFDDFRTISA